MSAVEIERRLLLLSTADLRPSLCVCGAGVGCCAPRFQSLSPFDREDLHVVIHWCFHELLTESPRLCVSSRMSPAAIELLSLLALSCKDSLSLSTAVCMHAFAIVDRACLVGESGSDRLPERTQEMEITQFPWKFHGERGKESVVRLTLVGRRSLLLQLPLSPSSLPFCRRATDETERQAASE